MGTNFDIMMMVRQEQLNEMRREAARNHLLKEAFSTGRRARQSIGAHLMNRFGGYLTFTGKIFIAIGERMKTEQATAQPRFAQEESC